MKKRNEMKSEKTLRSNATDEEINNYEASKNEDDLEDGIVNREYDGTSQIEQAVIQGKGISNSNTKVEDALDTYLSESLVQALTKPGNADDKESDISVKNEHLVATLPEKVGDIEFQEEKDEPPRLVRKIMKTVFLVLVWVCMGLCGEITGPTLLDLKFRMNSNYEKVSFGLSGRSLGFFVGSAMGGVLVDKFGLYCDLMVALGLNGDAFVSAAIPWMPNTNLLFLVTFLQGTMEGVMNISGQKLILEMWIKKAAGPLHLLHGGYGIGSFIIPLIANPFLAVRETMSENVTSGENVTFTSDVTIPTRLPTTTEVIVEDSRMEIAFFIAAAITVLVSTVFLGYHITGGGNKKHQKQKGKRMGAEKSDTRVLSFKEMINPATCAGGRFFYGVSIFVFVFLFFIQCVGGERVCSKFIRAYSIEHLGFSKDDGSYINTLFWVAFTVGRVLGLLTARFIPIRVLVMLESGGCLLTSILLVIFGENTTALWILMPTLGFFIAPLFPSGVGWANYHVEMTGVAITFFMLGGSVGAVIYLSLTGHLLDHYGYRYFLYILLGFGIASFVTSAVMNIIGAKHGSSFEAKKAGNYVNINEKNATYE